MKTLNTFEPKAFPTAMLPIPCLATIIEARMFGKLVPAAYGIMRTRVRVTKSAGRGRKVRGEDEDEGEGEGEGGVGLELVGDWFYGCADRNSEAGHGL